MKEEYKAYRVSILVGIIACVLTFFLTILIGGLFTHIFYFIVILTLSVIILSSELFKKMKEEYKPFCVSILVGIIACVVGGFLYNFIILSIHTFMLLLGIVPSTSVILLSSILSEKFPITWKIIRARFYCIILLLVIYTYFSMFFFGYSFSELLLAPFYFVIIIPFFIKMVPVGFLCSNVLTIPAAYVATREIENLPLRIKLVFLLAILICLAVLLPIISTMGY